MAGAAPPPPSAPALTAAAEWGSGKSLVNVTHEETCPEAFDLATSPARRKGSSGTAIGETVVVFPGYDRLWRGARPIPQDCPSARARLSGEVNRALWQNQAPAPSRARSRPGNGLGHCSTTAV